MPDATGQMLLRAIIEEPAADDVRLIYADWLQDHGDPVRAEFIRLQVRLATLDEDDPDRPDLERSEAVLLAAHRRRWWSEMAGVGNLDELHHEFRRGFPDTYWLPCERFLAVAGQLSTVTPLARLELSQVTGHLAALADCPALATVRRLAISGNWVRVAELGLLLGSPYLGRVEDLQLGCSDPGDELADLVARWPGAGSLRELTLYPEHMPARGVASLVTSPRLRNLRALTLPGVDTAGVRELVSAPSPPPLEELRLGGGAMDPEGLRLLARWPGLARVRWLQIPGNGEAGMAELASSPYLGGVSNLELGGGNIDPGAARILAHVESLRGVRHLWLARNPLGDEGLRELAASPHWGALRRLSLWECGIGDAGLRALAGAPTLRPVRLHLEDNPIGADGLAALAASPVLERIEELDLASTHIGDGGLVALARGRLGERVTRLVLHNGEYEDEGVRALVGAAWAGRLRELDLSYNKIGEDGGEALATSRVLGNLLELNLAHTKIGDRTAQALARWPGASSILRLDLRHNKITDDGLHALATSPYLNGIDALVLWGNQNTTAGLEALWARFGDRVYPLRRQWEGPP
jgi:uncharacterized protein (TIGR02996 family)